MRRRGARHRGPRSRGAAPRARASRRDAGAALLRGCALLRRKPCRCRIAPLALHVQLLALVYNKVPVDRAARLPGCPAARDRRAGEGPGRAASTPAGWMLQPGSMRSVPKSKSSVTTLRVLKILLLCTCYMVVGPTLILVNKHILKDAGFPYPSARRLSRRRRSGGGCPAARCAQVRGEALRVTRVSPTPRSVPLEPRADLRLGRLARLRARGLRAARAR